MNDTSVYNVYNDTYNDSPNKNPIITHSYQAVKIGKNKMKL